MIALRRAAERRHDRHRQHELWRTFYPREPVTDGFGLLESLDEDEVGPGAGVRLHPRRDAEIVTYVREGALAFEDSTGRSGVIRAGEFQCATVGRAAPGRETNASRSDPAHVFQVGLRAWQAGLEPCQEQRRFSAAERRGVLCVVASPDSRRGSLRLRQDALVISALLHPGQHVVHELPPGRSAWLHLVEGEATLGDVVLTTGDGAGVTAERGVSLTARAETEILLLDLGAAPPGATNHGGVM